MGQKLHRFSTVMAVLAIVPGLALWLHYGISGKWMMWKLILVLALIGYQLQSWRYVQQMKRNEVINSGLFFRIYNESALIIVIPILIMVVVKPV